MGGRILLAGVGVIATGTAIVGVWTPGIPTVPPLLIALWAFGKSSDRLHKKLTEVPMLKLALEEAEYYEKHRQVRFSAKIISQVCAWTSAILVWLLTQNYWLAGLTSVSALACSIFMFTTPTRRQ